MNKYKLVKEGDLFRIIALRDFGNIQKGDRGGLIEKESNLSHNDNCWVYDNARVYDDALVYGNARVCGNARICGNAEVYGDAEVCGDAEVYGDAEVCGDANIQETLDYLVIGPIGSRKAFTTFFRIRNNTINISCGCWQGTIEKFEKRVKETHGKNKYGKQYLETIKLIKKIII